MKIGDNATQNVTPITGVVQSIVYDVSSEGLLGLVAFTDADGVEHSRWFTEAEVTCTTPAPAKAPAQPAATA
jgi:hypothetical protein